MYVVCTVSRHGVGVNGLDIEITADDDSLRGGRIRNGGLRLAVCFQLTVDGEVKREFAMVA